MRKLVVFASALILWTASLAACDLSFTPDAFAASTRTHDLRPTVVSTVVRASDFLNSLGVGTKIIQGDNLTATENGASYLGIRWVRDDSTHSSNAIKSLCRLHAKTHVVVDELPIVDSDPNNISDTQREWEQLARCGAMFAAEGPNEPNNFSFTYAGAVCSSSSYTPCAHYQAALYQMVKKDRLLRSFPVIGLSDPGAEPENVGLQYLIIPSDAGTQMPPGTKYADVGNFHNYVQGNGGAGASLIDNHARYAETVSRSGPYAGAWDLWGEYLGDKTWKKGFPIGITAQNGIPKITSETGWNVYKAPLSREMQGKLITDLYLDAFQLGWMRTAVYEMFERPPNDAGWGFFNKDPSQNSRYNPSVMASFATPMGAYMHALTTILADSSSAFPLTPKDVTVAGLPSSTQDPAFPTTAYCQLMEKSDQSYYLVVWGEAFRSRTRAQVTVTLGSSFKKVNLYDITVGSTPISSYSNVSSVEVPISDHAMIVGFHD